MANIERRNSTHLKRRTSNGPSITVQVTGGPCAGNEYQLQNQETIIGRQADCDIVISDISVSRRHVSVSKENGSYILRDLGSGNGTYYRNALVPPDGVEIQDNSAFKIGDTELTFSVASGHRASRTHSREQRLSTGRGVEPRSIQRQRSGRAEKEEAVESVAGRRRGQRAPKKSKLKLVALSIIVIGLLAIFAKFAYEKNLADQQAALEFAEIKKQEEAIIDSIAAAVDKGRASTRKGEFKEAIGHFEEATKIATEHEQELPRDVKRNLDYAKKEVANQDLIEQSKALAKDNKLGEAVQALDKITEDSFFYNKVSEIKNEFRVYFPEYMIKAKKLLEEKSFDEAQEAVEEILVVDPREEQAIQLQAEIEKAAQLARRPVRKKVVAQAVEKVDVTAPILAVFYKGQIEAAIEQAKGCSEADCAKLLTKLEAFNAAFANVESDTEKAFSTLMAIPGAQKSSFYSAISSKISTTLTKAGIREMGSENYAAAFKAFQRVLSSDPGNNVARKHMGTIRQHAQELFQQGYVDKATDPESARRHFEKVIAMTDSKDDLNQKAKRHLKQLTGGY